MSETQDSKITARAAAVHSIVGLCIIAGIIKAIEVEAGLALPADVSIKVSRDNG